MVSDQAVLKKLWAKRMRGQLRSVNLKQFELGHDPLEWLSFEWEIDNVLADIKDDVLKGRYRAQSPEIVRSAKGSGLTRPLAFLDIRDLILYRSIVSFAENGLIATSREWTRFRREDVATGAVAPTVSNSGWFRTWLHARGIIWAMSGKYLFFVETDVANFFPYVQLYSVMDHVLTNSQIGEEVGRLLRLMLTQFAATPEYRVSPIVGLPQENFDCSRVLAHTYLKPVDDVLVDEGEEGRYSRYMDDIVIGSTSSEEALRQINRIQMALEPLGLYPNTAKTRIRTASQLLGDYMKDENDYLGLVDDQLAKGSTPDPLEFRRRLKAHLQLRVRPKAWESVIHRYYTAARRLRDQTLLRYAFGHLQTLPSSSRNTLDFLGTFPLTIGRHIKLVSALALLDGLYPDVEILSYEYLLTAPNRNEVALRVAIAGWAVDRLKVHLEFEAWRLAASAALVVGKFGYESHMDELMQLFQAMKGDTVVRRQVLIILLGAGRIPLKEVHRLALREGPLSDLAYLHALTEGDRRATKMALALAKPEIRRQPDRLTLRPRLIFLAPVLRQVAPKEWALTAPWTKRLKALPAGFRDRASERWYGLTPTLFG